MDHLLFLAVLLIICLIAAIPTGVVITRLYGLDATLLRARIRKNRAMRRDKDTDDYHYDGAELFLSRTAPFHLMPGAGELSPALFVGADLPACSTT